MKKIIYCFLILMASCSKEQVEFIKPGCKPSVIETKSSTFGVFDESYTESYTYENDKLIQLGIHNYEYDGNLVRKIHSGSLSFEEYSYNTSDKVIGSKKFRRENEGDEFVLVTQYRYEYEGAHLSKLINVLSAEEIIFYSNEVTFNIDSLRAFDSNGEISRIEYFEYDDKPNIYNICIPVFNFNIWIIRSTKNNIIKYEKHKPNSEVIGYYSVDITYNEFDYPSIATISFSDGRTKVRTISYVKCE